MYFKIIQFNEKHWITVESNLPVLFKSYSCPILLVITEVYVYEKCDVLLNQKKKFMNMKTNRITALFTVTDVVYGTTFNVNI